jgi:hypothetical protein
MSSIAWWANSIYSINLKESETQDPVILEAWNSIEIQSPDIYDDVDSVTQNLQQYSILPITDTNTSENIKEKFKNVIISDPRDNIEGNEVSDLTKQSLVQVKNPEVEETWNEEDVLDEDEVNEEDDETQEETQEEENEEICGDYESWNYEFSWTTQNWETQTLSYTTEQEFWDIKVWERTFTRTIKCEDWEYEIEENDIDWEITYENWYDTDDESVDCDMWHFRWRKKHHHGDTWQECKTNIDFMNLWEDLNNKEKDISSWTKVKFMFKDWTDRIIDNLWNKLKFYTAYEGNAEYEETKIYYNWTSTGFLNKNISKIEIIKD